MADAAPSYAIDISDSALAAIVAVLPPGSPPERVALLPAILRAWAERDLCEHLSREGRAAVRQRESRLQAVAKRGKALLHAVKALHERGFSEVALRPQMRRKNVELPDVDVETADHRRDQAISWLHDLIEAIEEPQPEPPPDKRTRSYLIVLDLAAIFELVTCEKPTRRIDAYADAAHPYGPFWNFVNAVCATLTDVRSLDRALKDVRFHSGSEYSTFVANLQFRHPALWQELTGRAQ